MLFMRIFKKIIMGLSTLFPSGLRVMVYRLLGFRIGKKVRIAPMSIIIADEVAIDDYAEIKPLTLINVRKIEMGRYAIIASLSAIFGDADLYMAERSRVGHANLLDCTDNIFLGEYCGLGPRNTLYTHASWLPITYGYPNNRKPIKLGKFIWTGIGNTILPGTNINDYVVTSANIVLSGNVKGDCFVRPKGTIPIEKIRKQRDLKEIVEEMAAVVGEELRVFSESADISNSSLKDCEVVILFTKNDSIIDKAGSCKKQILAFVTNIDEKEMDYYNQTRIDWYDFSTLTMSSHFHQFKSVVMKKLVDLGGLRFLERRP